MNVKSGNKKIRMQNAEKKKASGSPLSHNQGPIKGPIKGTKEFRVYSTAQRRQPRRVFGVVKPRLSEMDKKIDRDLES